MNPIDILNGAVDKVGDTVRDAIGLGRTKSSSTEAAHFSVEKFKAEVFDKGLAAEDRFEVIISAPQCLSGSGFDFTEMASLLCEQVFFPQLAIFTKQLHIYGPAYQRPVMSDYGGDGLSMTFLLDQDMKIKQMFDYWMQCIINVDNYTVSYLDEYKCRIEIRQLDKSDHVIYTCIIDDAFPKNMQFLNLSQQSAGAFHRLHLTMAYRKWTIKQLPAIGANASQGARNAYAQVLDQRAGTLKDIASKYNLNMTMTTLTGK